MKETDDGNEVNVADVGSTPTTSTNSLTGRNVHGIIERPPEWYMSQRSWDRQVGFGKLPLERDESLKKELDKLEEEIKNRPVHLKPHTIQWERILELKRILGV
ncbi:MAG: hypothetical protein QGH83_07300 [Candidatus Pacebacteria bacterium]|nr:hypothetical protein [Candidatus Paceibacterota bacterium]